MFMWGGIGGTPVVMVASLCVRSGFGWALGVGDRISVGGYSGVGAVVDGYAELAWGTGVVQMRYTLVGM